MQLDPASGWCQGVCHCPSPNFNARPNGEVSLLVIHNISLPPGQFATGKVQEFFQNRLDVTEHPYFEGISELRVSAHFLIERDGKITQFVSCLDRAWHAGVSSFEGRETCNDFSLGIELEGTDDLPFSDAQYQALIGLTRQLQAAFPDVKPNGSNTFYNILNVALPFSPEKTAMILFNLDMKGIAVSRGSACQSGSIKPSHVLAEMLSDADLAKPSLRISFSHYNTTADIDYLIKALQEV